MYTTIKDERKWADQRRRDHLPAEHAAVPQEAADKAVGGHGQVRQAARQREVGGVQRLPELGVQRQPLRGAAGLPDHPAQGGQKGLRRLQDDAAVLRAGWANQRTRCRSSSPWSTSSIRLRRIINSNFKGELSPSDHLLNLYSND